MVWSKSIVMRAITAIAVAAVIAPRAGKAQAPSTPPRAAAKHVTVERIKVHSGALEGNLEKESPDRDVVVYLPPDYASEKKASGIPWSMYCTATG